MVLPAQSRTEQLRPSMAPTDFTTLKTLRSVSLTLFSLSLRYPSLSFSLWMFYAVGYSSNKFSSRDLS
uniref:Uncharacterized protein n=1 Tax=Cannabis sativa TaxID=3483 RepID=A0A803R8X9_CANSA